jgi:hypothetical protein
LGRACANFIRPWVLFIDRHAGRPLWPISLHVGLAGTLPPQFRKKRVESRRKRRQSEHCGPSDAGHRVHPCNLRVRGYSTVRAGRKSNPGSP